MKILLVSPRNALLNQFNYPLGLAYVSSALKQAGFDVVCHNNAVVDDNEAVLAAVLEKTRPDMVGCGGLTPSFGHIRRVFDLAREVVPGTVAVLGGAVLSSEPEVFRAIGADYGVMGEGEITMVELASALKNGSDPAQVAGLLMRGQDGTLRATGHRELIPDLDSLQLPDYSEFSFEICHSKSGTVDIIASRGCPYHCTFCYSIMGRGRYRIRSLDNLFEEIDLLVKQHGVRQIGVMDDLFTLKPERVVAFCERIKEYGIAWYTQVRIDSIDEDTLRLMKDAGCTCVFYGLESMDESVLKSMNKKITPAQIERTLELTHACGLKQYGNFIFGDPVETPGSMRTTLRWWLAHKKHFINLGKIDCWPGTKIYHQALQRGLIKDRLRFIEEGCPITNLTDMPEADFRGMLERIWSLHQSMTFPGKIERAVQRGKDWNLRLSCPHCGTSRNWTRVNELPDHEDRGAARVDCPNCGLWFDVPVSLPPKILEPEHAETFREALRARQDGDSNKAAALLRELVQIPTFHPAVFYTLGLLRLESGELDMGRVAVGIGLRHNPCEPRLHELLGMLLKSGGEFEFGMAYLEQAHILRAAREGFFASRCGAAARCLNPLWDESFLADAVPGQEGPAWGRGAFGSVTCMSTS